MNMAEPQPQGPQEPSRIVIPQDIRDLGLPGSLISTENHPPIQENDSLPITTTDAMANDTTRFELAAEGTALPLHTKQQISGLRADVNGSREIFPTARMAEIEAKVDKILTRLDKLDDMDRTLKTLDHEAKENRARAQNQRNAVLLQPMRPLPVKPDSEHQLPRKFVNSKITSLIDINDLPPKILDEVLVAYGLDVPEEKEKKSRLIWHHLGGH